MTKERIYNFSAGPAVLSLEVLKEVEQNLLNYQGSGIGILEMSHRGPEFTEIIETCEKNLRNLLDINDNYAVLFMTGGASNQFSCVPMNLLGKGQTADYILTGSWSKKAAKEAKKFGEVHIAASTENQNFNNIPKSYEFSKNSAYVHFTSNNTIFGTQWKSEPACGKRTLVCDASSDILHKKIDINKYGLLYAGAQKNLGPAGVTLVIIRKDLLEKIPNDLPIMMDYRTYSENQSLYNTPPCIAIYVLGETFKWLKKMGGLNKMAKRNQEKAKILYDFIDGNDFYIGTAEKDSRSLMNVCFLLKNKDLESNFISEAQKAGFSGLKGHRSVGGMRASIYNAFPKKGVQDLVAFMKNFSDKNG